MNLTTSIIQAGTGCASAVAAQWLPALQAACDQYQINTAQRVAAFLSQIGVESASLTAVVENLNYSAQGLLATWPTRFTEQTAAQYARQPQAIANYVYAGRNGNGPTASGDGWAFRGRGLIQITGRANYAAAGAALGIDAVDNPDLLAQPANAAMSAAWYFSTHGCNALADTGNTQAITRAINGGLTGYPQRLQLYGAALKALAA